MIAIGIIFLTLFVFFGICLIGSLGDITKRYVISKDKTTIFKKLRIL